MKRKLRDFPPKSVIDGEDSEDVNVASLVYTEGGCRRRYPALEARNCENTVIEGSNSQELHTAQDTRAFSTVPRARLVSILRKPVLTGTACSRDLEWKHGGKKATPGAIVQRHGDDVETCGIDDRYPFGEEGTTEQVEYWTLSEQSHDLHAAGNGGGHNPASGQPNSDDAMKQDTGLDMDAIIYSEWLIYSQAQNSHHKLGSQQVGDCDLPTRGSHQSICDKSEQPGGGGQGSGGKKGDEPNPQNATSPCCTSVTKNPVLHLADEAASESTALQNGGHSTDSSLSIGAAPVVRHRDSSLYISDTTRDRVAVADGDVVQRAIGVDDHDEGSERPRKSSTENTSCRSDVSQGSNNIPDAVGQAFLGGDARLTTSRTVIEDARTMFKMGADTTHEPAASPSRTDDRGDLASGNPNDNGPPHRHVAEQVEADHQPSEDPRSSHIPGEEEEEDDARPRELSAEDATQHKHCETEALVSNSGLQSDHPPGPDRCMAESAPKDKVWRTKSTAQSSPHTTRYSPPAASKSRWYDLDRAKKFEHDPDGSRRQHHHRARYNSASRYQDVAHRRHPQAHYHEQCGRDSRRGGGGFRVRDRNRGSPPFTRYRSSGGGSSGLGGYSPRRPRFKNAAHTPSPPARTPERKKCRAWDLPPSALDAHNENAGQQQAKLDAFLLGGTCCAAAGLASPGSPFAIKGKASPLLSAGRKQQQHHICAFTPLTLSQAPRTLRRLYIGNVPVTVSDGELLEFLNAAMLSANISSIPGTKPCVNCSVHVEKNYAFAEFVTPEDATAAMAFDGVMLHGTVLKIKRPKDYVQPVNGSPIPVPNLVSNVVPDSAHKIFLGGISFSLSAHKEKVKEIVTSFGQLKSFHWEVDSTKTPPQVYAFFEYVDPKVTIKACAGLNGLPVANSIWTCVRATPDVSSAQILDKPSYLVPPSAVSLLQAPTHILELQNLVSPEEFLSMTETGICEYVEDIRLECARFGRIKCVHMTRPPTSSTARGPTNSQQVVDGPTSCVDEQGAAKDDTKIERPLTQPGSSDNKECVDMFHTWGRVYVEFAREDSALRAASCLHGRMYGDKHAAAGYFPTQGTFGKFTVPVVEVFENNDTDHGESNNGS